MCERGAVQSKIKGKKTVRIPPGEQNQCNEASTQEQQGLLIYFYKKTVQI